MTEPKCEWCQESLVCLDCGRPPTTSAHILALCDELAADSTLQLAPGWMARDACVAKVRALLTEAS